MSQVRTRGANGAHNTTLEGTAKLDVLVADPVETYLQQVAQTLEALPRAAIWEAVEFIIQTGLAQRRIYLVGNGGSAATASHMANDLNKQASVPGNPRLRAIALTDNVPLITAWSNDLHYDDCFSEQLANHLEPGDLVIAISTSGNSENVLRAVELARSVGARSIGFTGSGGGQLGDLVDCCIFVPCEDVGQQEDIHLVLNHVITTAIRARLAAL